MSDQERFWAEEDVAYIKAAFQNEFLFLASTPGLYRKKCNACQDDDHFNSKECKRCGGALDIQSPGRPRGTTASEGYGVSVVHATCSYGYE